ncbi:MAG: hypothetical protein HY587_05280 [Candidatus Omnitrophica bacterium]|nr:hypothetical protein [Candidatus Omnitrophota bacterium]
MNWKRKFALLMFLVLLSSQAFALNSKERLWVIGEESDQPSTLERSLHVFNAGGQEIKEIPGQGDFVPVEPPLFSVNGPWVEFVHVRDSAGPYAATDKGIIYRKHFSVLGPFYVHRQNLAYMLHGGGLIKINLQGTSSFAETILLKSSDYHMVADFKSRIAADRSGRIYFSIGNHLFRYTESSGELLDEEVDFPVNAIDTSVDKAYIAAGADGIIEVSNSFGFSEFSDLSPVDYLAVDAQGNVYTAVEGTLWQIALGGTETEFSGTTFDHVTGIGISHGE